MLSPIADQSPGFREIFPRVSDFKNYNESDRIAFKAVEICQLKDSIFIGVGQTAFLMGQYLLKTSVHIYTNYLPLITLLISESFPHTHLRRY